MRTTLRRLSREEMWVAELQLWAISHFASVCLVDIEPYERCTVAGIVVRWRIDPVDGYIEATLFDGTGELVARWPSKRLPSPLRARREGRGMVLEGIPTIDPGGDVVMIDPKFRRADFPAVA